MTNLASIVVNVPPVVGGITQDQDGSIVLSPNGEGGGGSGLVYETGTYTPTEDIVRPEIMFSNSHTSMPLFIMMSEAVGNYLSTTYSNFEFFYMDWELFAGYPYYQSTTAPIYGMAYNRYRSTGASTSTASVNVFTNPSSNTGDSGVSYPRYFAKTDRFYQQTSSSVYWRSGRTYKWIAVWAPTS